MYWNEQNFPAERAQDQFIPKNWSLLLLDLLARWLIRDQLQNQISLWIEMDGSQEFFYCSVCDNSSEAILHSVRLASGLWSGAKSWPLESTVLDTLGFFPVECGIIWTIELLHWFRDHWTSPLIPTPNLLHRAVRRTQFPCLRYSSLWFAAAVSTLLLRRWILTYALCWICMNSQFWHCKRRNWMLPSSKPNWLSPIIRSSEGTGQRMGGTEAELGFIFSIV